MIESRAQRTLVKSPPELWAELSDPIPLARHLAEIDGGEIRITRVEPEKTVVWEGDRAGGTVELEPSGWGTKVTITLRQDLEPEAAGEEAVATPEAVVAIPEPVAMPEGAAAMPEPAAEVEAEVEPATPEPTAEGPPDQSANPASPVAPAGRLRRWLERRRARWSWSEEPDHAGAESASAPAGLATEPEPGAEPEPAAESEPVPAAEPAAVSEPVPAAEPPPTPAAATPPPPDSGRGDELLAGVLDSLGSAHHRPFSRS